MGIPPGETVKIEAARGGREKRKGEKKTNG
jgi:hypothetical protein